MEVDSRIIIIIILLLVMALNININEPWNDRPTELQFSGQCKVQFICIMDCYRLSVLVAEYFLLF